MPYKESFMDYSTPQIPRLVESFPSSGGRDEIFPSPSGGGQGGGLDQQVPGQAHANSQSVL